MSWRHIIIAGLSMLACAGCSGMGQTLRVIDTVDADYRLPGTPGKGLLIASTRYTTDCKEGEAPQADVFFWSNWYSDVTLEQIPLTGPAEERDIQDPPGYLIVREVKAAQHDLRYIAINLRKMELKTRVPVMVDEGKAIYLGELHLSYLNCHGRPSVSLQVRDAWDRDRQLLEKKMPNLRSEDVIKRLLPPNLR